jgi:hypothetical protein
MSQPKRNLKLFPSPPDSRDHIIKYTPIRAAKATTSADLSVNCTSIKDQGQLGSCTAFASVGAMEYLQKKFNKATTQDIFSERFTYYATRVNVLGWTTDDSGAYIRDAIRSLVKFGTCKEATFPYNGDCVQSPSPAAYTEAMKYQALSYARLADNAPLAAVKACIDSGYPLVGGITCFSNIWNAVNGVIPATNGQIIGGHAILIVGYDDSTQRLKFKNSWSASWGDKGYGYLPYSYYTPANMYDLWTIYTAEDNDMKAIGLEVVNPAIAKQVLQNSTSDVLTAVNDNLDTVLDKNKYAAFFTDLLAQHKDKPKLITLINMLRSQFAAMAT